MTEKISIQDQYYYYYMISLHKLFHMYNCEWAFHSLSDKTFINGTNLKYDEFRRNKYLISYQDNKIGLAEDILTNGMYFPYFVYGLKNEQENENTINLALGKHRLYSKLLYQHKYNKNIDKKFLFIYIPNSTTETIKKPVFNFYFYGIFNNEVKILDTLYTNCRTQLIKYFDLVGGGMSDSLIDTKILTNPILNDEELFRQFIESPLDENNIMFKYYAELKEAE